MACTANTPQRPHVPYAGPATGVADTRIGIARDAAFGFYYPGDLEALQRAGAELVPIDSLADARLPEVDGLFIGGGFPETHAERLSANVSLRTDILTALENGMPAYAECAGLMYLSRSLNWQDRRHDMVGFIPGDAVMHERPVGRGYMLLRETPAMPWPGQEGHDENPIPAHEFHYASLENLPDDTVYAYQVERGAGISDGRDGIVLGNVLAGFSHQRNQANNVWAERFVSFVRACRDTQSRKTAGRTA